MLIFGFLGNNVVSDNLETRNTERKNDINDIYVNLEKHYASFGYYPTIDEFINDKLDTLPGVDLESYIDPNGKKIPDGDYRYTPSECRAVGCDKYKLEANLESESDSNTKYAKENLN